MHPLTPLIGVIALVALATAVGVLLRTRKGRVRRLAGGAPLEPEVFGAVRFGTVGTVVQFSTEFCSRCPGVRRLLAQRVSTEPGLDFIHVDLTNDPDLASRFGVLQTPTILFVDASGRPSTRLSGQLDHQAIREAVDSFVDGAEKATQLVPSGVAAPATRSTRTTSTGAAA